MSMEMTWTSTAEQLPERDTEVLVSIRWPDGRESVQVSRWWQDSFGTQHWLGLIPRYVAAWMPLPEPVGREEERHAAR